MNNFNRYQRQMILPNFGETAQSKLLKSSVLVVGAGGLGCPILTNLSAAGVGNIGVIDNDNVEMSNLHRQMLFEEQHVGLNKSEVAKTKLQQLNSQISIYNYAERLTKENVFEITKKYEIIVDATDNFETRYLLNDVCGILGKPLIYGSIFQFEGQVSVFHYGKEKINYRDIFPKMPNQNEVPTCNETGVLGVLTNIIGSFQANEVIKIIIGAPNILSGKIMIFSLKNYSQNFIFCDSIENNNYPKNEDEILKNNYEMNCDFLKQIHSKIGFDEIAKQGDYALIDVRELYEEPKLGIAHIKIPLSKFENHYSTLQIYKNLIFVCQSGLRSLKAIELSKTKFRDKVFYNIKNGINTII